MTDHCSFNANYFCLVVQASLLPTCRLPENDEFLVKTTPLAPKIFGTVFKLQIHFPCCFSFQVERSLIGSSKLRGSDDCEFDAIYR